jgi:hypothetical protein
VPTLRKAIDMARRSDGLPTAPARRSTASGHAGRGTGGAALARCTVERLIKAPDPDAPTRANLDARIERIKSQVSVPLGEMLDVLRVTGNGTLHVDDQRANSW